MTDARRRRSPVGVLAKVHVANTDALYRLRTICAIDIAPNTPQLNISTYDVGCAFDSPTKRLRVAGLPTDACTEAARPWLGHHDKYGRNMKRFIRKSGGGGSLIGRSIPGPDPDGAQRVHPSTSAGAVQ